MKNIIITKTSLLGAMENLSQRQAIKTIRCLKEAAIRDQRFNTAVFLRDEEKRLTGGKSGVNTLRKPHTAKRKP